jgi:hypothetical protein
VLGGCCDGDLGISRGIIDLARTELNQASANESAGVDCETDSLTSVYLGAHDGGEGKGEKGQKKQHDCCVE